MATSTTRTTPSERSIREVVRLTGVTSRTLRHYHAIGLLHPTRVAADGTRHYGPAALVRLQRVLLLRELGVPLAGIREALGDDGDELAALRRHLQQLDEEAARLARRRASVARTITALEEGGHVVAEEMFDGFDHTRHREEVVQRWGEDAYSAGDRWWRGMPDAERTAWQRRTRELGEAWTAAAAAGVAPDSAEAQELARRHVAWLASVPGTPGYGTGRPDPEYLLGLGDMYVADPRFAAVYGGEAGARLVRDALRLHLQG